MFCVNALERSFHSVFFFFFFLQKRKNDFLEELVESKSETENEQEEPRASYNAGNQRNYKRLLELSQKGSGASMN